MNSLLTDWTMWNYVVPYFLDPPSSQETAYNVLLHSQRGHGLSALRVPPSGNTAERLTTIPLLADDVCRLLEALFIPTPVHSVVGVSQGGAAALAFAAQYPSKTKSVVACDTAPQTPAGNQEAWEDRIRLVYGPTPASTVVHPDVDGSAYAKAIGMGKLADVTVPRWFPASAKGPQQLWIKEMITRTDVAGFAHGARALGDYDVLAPAPSRAPLFDGFEGNVLLLAGSLDGGGKVASGLKSLRDKWDAHRQHRPAVQGANTIVPVEFLEIRNAGHLPMIDFPSQFCDALTQWMQSF
ncbi:hypothetical protein HYPSUDRAFT_682298 [Hypholoma sublateritium FD-334 SS-4]|uniref:AB hydrolase-1 domain-containing protein n=1 Tax=Hypholoma sublateritium (strain FD-334 SS-4) TaxID=945553 RepID=A0A0D2NSI1_HYPSF|nr:hypothetical protein HYPSUDRAFT_682298 [Hypholoma sublateritium FD-334 SS-4]